MHLFDNYEQIKFLWDRNKDIFAHDIRILIPKGTLGLCCIHMAQLITHTAVMQKLFTLQLCYKPFGILQRVTKS